MLSQIVFLGVPILYEDDLENTSLEKGAMLSIGNHQALGGIQFLENLIIRKSVVQLYLTL